MSRILICAEARLTGGTVVKGYNGEASKECPKRIYSRSQKEVTMGIFKKLVKPNEKKSLKERMSELLDEIQALPDEEQKAFWKDFEDDQDDSKGETDTAEQIDKAEEDIAEKGADSQTEKDRIYESVGEQEAEDGDADSQDAKDRVDESVGEQEEVDKSESERVEAEDAEEVNAAMGARISALEEQLAGLAERLEQMLSNFENQDFGAHQGGGAEEPATEDDEAYMDAYYAKQQRRK